ncbi:NnrU family protein [Rhodoferax aquaticus]|uniref:Protein NrnU n=1 Tax=Rhodoferax aquaticus TaxID=2527691 RepID=A0A515EJ49_9BURK|nr:NnrU family protein [Rhodoferax aquaticus]QDL52695.1 protein NrnU [Rhodoferax aquaticus]
MVYLVLGLLLFIGVHSIRIFSDTSRTQWVLGFGEGRYKFAFSLVSALGLGLIVWGFGQARENPLMLWIPPQGMRHLAALLTWVAFLFIAAAYVPGNYIKARLHHPMVLGVKAWALAHLLATGSVAHLVLFGCFLLWATASFRAARRRDRITNPKVAGAALIPTLGCVAMGTLLWAVFAFFLHGLLIGIRPFG